METRAEYTEKRCPTCGQVIPYVPYVRAMAIGTWRKQEHDEEGYLKFRGGFHRIMSISPHPKDGWKAAVVVTPIATYVVGPTTWVYEEIALDNPPPSGV